ncbi:MAG: hypothetical protein U0X75_02275 [Acidobacteriota bacterium]
MSLNNAPTNSEIELIGQLGDPAIRNLRITQCYHELSAALSQRFGLSANWCTFATWASKQAGQTIRGEDLRRKLEHALESAPELVQAVAKVVLAVRQLGGSGDESHVRRVLRETLRLEQITARTSEAVARGNLKVFAEIGREFARFISECLPDQAPNETSVTQFCASLRAGDPPQGQEYLRRAFAHYYRALFITDAKAKAELLLLANLEIGFHEQTRLQPEIAASLDAPLLDAETVTTQLLKSLFPFAGIVVRARTWFKRLWQGPTPLELAVNVLVAEIRRLLHTLITDHLMTLTLSQRRLQLGKDVLGTFPASLQHISEAELQALVRRIDPTTDSLRDSGAVDWANLAERLHFIADLFRCFHEAPELFDPPFTAEQLVVLKTDRLPDGRL